MTNVTLIRHRMIEWWSNVWWRTWRRQKFLITVLSSQRRKLSSIFGNSSAKSMIRNDILKNQTLLHSTCIFYLFSMNRYLLIEPISYEPWFKNVLIGHRPVRRSLGDYYEIHGMRQIWQFKNSNVTVTYCVLELKNNNV